MSFNDISLNNIKYCLEHQIASEICLVIAFGALLYALISPFVGMY